MLINLGGLLAQVPVRLKMEVALVILRQPFEKLARRCAEVPDLRAPPTSLDAKAVEKYARKHERVPERTGRPEHRKRILAARDVLRILAQELHRTADDVRG